jgi:hypothetical protein
MKMLASEEMCPFHASCVDNNYWTRTGLLENSENLSYYLIVLLTNSKNHQSDEVVIVQHILRSLKCVSNEH